MNGLEAIKRRLAAAPEGPYQWEGPCPPVMPTVLGTYRCRDKNGNGLVAELPAYEWPEFVAARDLIAHSWSDLAALVAVVEAAIRYITEDSDEVKDWDELYAAVMEFQRANEEGA